MTANKWHVAIQLKTVTAIGRERERYKSCLTAHQSSNSDMSDNWVEQALGVRGHIRRTQQIQRKCGKIHAHLPVVDKIHEGRTVLAPNVAECQVRHWHRTPFSRIYASLKQPKKRNAQKVNSLSSALYQKKRERLVCLPLAICHKAMDENNF